VSAFSTPVRPAPGAGWWRSSGTEPVEPQPLLLRIGERSVFEVAWSAKVRFGGATGGVRVQDECDRLLRSCDSVGGF
jgi:hypothetical protein